MGVPLSLWKGQEESGPSASIGGCTLLFRGQGTALTNTLKAKAPASGKIGLKGDSQSIS